MSEYTPSTEDVREGWREAEGRRRDSGPQFDRWLKAEREAQMRFWTKVNKTDGCWLWTANIATNGYGRVKISGRDMAAHRVAYEWLVGPIPEGLELDHVADRGCRSRACVNPDHLEPVTHRVNTARGETITAAQSARTQCPQGHPLAGDNLVPSSLKKGRRDCLTCSRERARRQRRRKVA